MSLNAQLTQVGGDVARPAAHAMAQQSSDQDPGTAERTLARA